MPGSAGRRAFDEDVLLGPPGAEKGQGRIHYSPEYGPSGTVMGADWLIREDGRQHWPSLQGESFTGVPISLLDVAGRRREFNKRRGRAHLAARTLVAGAHVAGPEELELGRIAFSLRGLREWMAGGWSELPATAGEGRADPSVWMVNLSIGDADLQLVSEVTTGGGRYRSVEERVARVSVTIPGRMSLPRWRREWITPLLDLMVFANRERSVLTALSGYTEPDTRHGALNVFERQETAIAPETSFSFYQRDLLPAGIIDTGELIGRWIDLHRRIGPATTFLFGTLNAADLPLENEFLNLMAFAEAYHRTVHDEPPLSRADHTAYRALVLDALPEDPAVRDLFDRDLSHTNRQSQRERMRWLVGRAEREDWSDGLAEQIVAGSVDSRNWLTHWGGKGKRVVEDADLAILNRRLVFVIEANLLSDLGLDEEAVGRCLGLGYVWDYPF